MKNGGVVDNNRMYTQHGRRKFQGVWGTYKGSKIFGFLNNEDKLVGFSTLEEMMQGAYATGLHEFKDDDIDFGR